LEWVCKLCLHRGGTLSTGGRTPNGGGGYRGMLKKTRSPGIPRKKRTDFTRPPDAPPATSSRAPGGKRRSGLDGLRGGPSKRRGRGFFEDLLCVLSARRWGVSLRFAQLLHGGGRMGGGPRGRRGGTLGGRKKHCGRPRPRFRRGVSPMAGGFCPVSPGGGAPNRNSWGLHRKGGPCLGWADHGGRSVGLMKNFGGRTPS